jgi:hypothetical protein
VIGAASAAALLISIGLLCARRIDTALQLCALQAVVAAASLGRVAPAFAVVACILNGVALPLAVVRWNGATFLATRGRAVPAWATVLALLTATELAVAKVGVDGSVAAGVSVALLGVLLIILRAHALAPVLGLLSSQNGLVMLAGAHPDLSPQTALAVALPLLPALALAESRLRR